MSIELEKLSYVYMPGTPYQKMAVNQIDLLIRDQEFIGLIGPTGSGKSTLAQLLNGLLLPTQGNILVDGSNIRGKNGLIPGIFQKVGLVFQYPEYQLFAETVYDDVAFGLRNAGTPEDEIVSQVRETLGLVGLNYEEIKDRSPFNLSGGQKRRVAIAGVMVMKPRILVLDEPTAGLDPSGRKEIISLIHRYQQKWRSTVIWISHNMDEVALLANRLVVLNKGEILLEGTPKEVFSRENDLKQVGLAIPGAAALIRKLKTLGKSLPGQAVTLDEAYQEITQWLGRRGSDQ